VLPWSLFGVNARVYIDMWDAIGDLTGAQRHAQPALRVGQAGMPSGPGSVLPSSCVVRTHRARRAGRWGARRRRATTPWTRCVDTRAYVCWCMREEMLHANPSIDRSVGRAGRQQAGRQGSSTNNAGLDIHGCAYLVVADDRKRVAPTKKKAASEGRAAMELWERVFVKENQGCRAERKDRWIGRGRPIGLVREPQAKANLVIDTTHARMIIIIIVVIGTHTHTPTHTHTHTPKPPRTNKSTLMPIRPIDRSIERIESPPSPPASDFFS
jgi:hypothetical protein